VEIETPLQLDLEVQETVIQPHRQEIQAAQEMEMETQLQLGLEVQETVGIRHQLVQEVPETGMETPYLRVEIQEG